MTARRLSLPAALTIVCLALSGITQAALADTLQDASKALKQGQHAQALEQVDRYLAGKPKDAQGRFLKGVILTEMGKSSDAISIFSKLTEDYPELPEPYNNLAVIYAQQKQYEKAKQSLEMAIRTHPSYATAHENLGDLYARMASQAYDKALQLDSSNVSAQTKLSLIRDLMGSSGKATNVAKAEPPTKPIETPPPAAKPVTPPTPTVVPTPAPPVVTPPPVVVAKQEPIAPKVEKPEASESSGDTTRDINKSLEAWSTAWSKKDVKNYLVRYAKDFKTPDGQSRSAWETERAQRINKPGKISVAVENVHVTTEASDRATVKFRQHYKSASLSTSSNKVLVMIKRDGKWLIQQERVGN